MKKEKLVAVIDVGSLAIRMVIAEIRPGGDWHILDRAERPVPLGRDVFTTGRISRDSMTHSLKIMGDFKEMLSGWQIENRDVRAIATSAVREATNRDIFIDRVELQTGFLVNAIEGIEANRLTYLAVRHALRDTELRFDRSNSLIIEVGGGSTELMLLESGRMVAAHNMNIGTVRVEQQIKSVLGSADFLNRYLMENTRAALEIIDKEFELQRIETFISVGGDARLAARKVGQPVSDRYAVVDKQRFAEFVKELQNMPVDDLVGRLQIPYHDAEGLVPALLIYELFLAKTSADRMIVPDVSIREGVLLSLTETPESDVQQDFDSQIIASAVSLGRKYHFDEKHAEKVTELSLSLFDQLQEAHGLDKTTRLLLEVAAWLHDIGTYIHYSSHHKHGRYLIANAEIFGMHKDDINIVSNVVRYHRRALPKRSHMESILLPRESRIIIIKLASMLRVADALDKGHRQRVIDLKVEKRERELVIRSSHQGDLSIERFGLAQKADMMEEVFGLRVVLA